MSFPRNPNAGRKIDGTFRGVNVFGENQSGPFAARIAVDGEVHFLHDDCSFTEDAIYHIIEVLNGAMRGALKGLNTDWSAYGMHIRDAINVIPDLHCMSEELRERLRNAILFAHNSAVGMQVNALLAIESFHPVSEYWDVLDVMACATAAFKAALGVRQQLISKYHESRPLDHDVETHRWLLEDLRCQCEARRMTFDDKRLCVVMPAGRGGDKHFINSAVQIIMHANAAGKRVDMLLGLNQVDFPRAIEALHMSDVELHHLYVNEDRSTGMNGNSPLLLNEDVFDNSKLRGDKYVMGEADPKWNRIFAVRQQRTAWNAGKNPLQGVLMRMLHDRLLYGGAGKVPSQILLADADSWFVQEPHDRELDTVDIMTNGVEALMQEKKRRGLAIIGARGKSAQYDERYPHGPKIPHFGMPVDPIYRLLDVSAEKNVQFMPGGGTLGDFLPVLSLLTIICHRYPGSRTEDMHSTILANAAGVQWGVSKEARVANEVRQNSLDQPMRWFSGAAGLRKLYGGKAFDGITDARALRETFTGAEWKDALQIYKELIQHGKDHPDDPRHGDASWNA
ncbi:MAG: hypothetical protein Greene041662_549 [Candidatus Peregrinibacteria bacterium Greene0416_62]|nr:MAG: hypothetical protein Greene041662_549 [Candidatus Peregrinibacteria bacterium Greene0416_62]TSC99408.1 MAG: hypothetical protein Greene101449_619 [Candidatus Peregrinibacteria bacterium Greene1014_49]